MEARHPHEAIDHPSIHSIHSSIHPSINEHYHFPTAACVHITRLALLSGNDDEEDVVEDEE
jgi:hypothetical protein